MKQIIFFFFISITTVLGQAGADPVYLPIDSTTGAVQFREVVSTDSSSTAKALLQRARTWVATAYRNANDVVQQYDPDSGILIVKGQFPMTKVYSKGQPLPTNIPVYHMLTIEAKTGRYRVTMNNFEQVSGTVRAAIKANRGSMSEQELLAEVQKSAAGTGMEKMVMRYAQKNINAGLLDNRLYTLDFKNQVLSILASLKQEMKKKAEKDW